MDTIKSEMWNIQVAEGTMDMAHGMYHNIQEIYIPSKNISINLGLNGTTLYCFKSYEGRYGKEKGDVKIKDIDINKTLVNTIEQYIKDREEISKEISGIFKCKN
jgi:hypothetical protein